VGAINENLWLELEIDLDFGLEIRNLSFRHVVGLVIQMMLQWLLLERFGRNCRFIADWRENLLLNQQMSWGQMFI